MGSSCGLLPDLGYTEGSEESDAEAWGNWPHQVVNAEKPDLSAGVQADRDQAVYWFKQAAERGNATAASNLGYIYANGIGVMADAAEAIAWYRRAVNLGHVESQDALRALQGATGVVAQRWQ